MPPKKRKASTKAAAPAVKKVRMDESSIVAEPEEQLPSRPKRKSIGTPQYNFTRPHGRIKKEANSEDEADEADTLIPDPPKRRGRPPKAQATVLPTPKVATTAQAVVRPARNKSNQAATEEAEGTTVTKKRGRPKSTGVSTAKAAPARKSAAAKKEPASATPKAAAKPAQTTTQGTDAPGKHGRGPGRPRKIQPVRTITSLMDTISSDVSGTDDLDGEERDDEQHDRQYWLMKAEPNDRFENGVNVSYSIDDLAATDTPEAWDGIRNFAARNNMRAMRKNDLAFFYHSNCPVPGIVGIMRIVQEHTPDQGALDPNHPYYDPKSSPDNPRWDVVHVEFVKKFDSMVTLKMLQENKINGGELKDMQLLRMGRLSVSKVSAVEWRGVLELANEDLKVGEDGGVAGGVAEGYESDTDGEVEGSVKEEVVDGDGVAAEMDVQPKDTLSPAGSQAEDGIE